MLKVLFHRLAQDSLPNLFLNEVWLNLEVLLCLLADHRVC